MQSQGQNADQGRPGRGGARAARRGDGRGRRRRAVAGRHRDRLLRRHRRLRGGLRPAARPGVDRRPRALVRAPARHGRVQRPLPRAPRRDHAGPRRLGARRSPRRARARERSERGDEPRGRGPGAVPARPRSTGCAATLPRPRRPTATPAAAAGSRSRASRCCGWRRATPRRRPAPIRRALGETAEPLERAKLLPARAEIALAPRRRRRGAREACDELAAIAARYASPMLRRDRRPGPRRGRAGGGRPGRRAAAAPRRACGSGSSSTRPTRWRGRAC